MMQKNEQIKIALESLDINSIHSVLNHLNIEWRVLESKESRIPTINDIKIIAENCMLRAFESENKSFTIGGFEANVIEGIVEIKYILAYSNPLSKILG